MHLGFIFYISRQDCIISLIADLHSLKTILPFAIKMSLNFNYSLSFHVLIDLIPVQKSGAPIKKKSPLRVIQEGDFYKTDLSGNREIRRSYIIPRTFALVTACIRESASNFMRIFLI